MHKHLKEILEEIDNIRVFILPHPRHDADLRASIRRIVQRVEQLQNTPCIKPEQHQFIASLLSQLVDAEHGMLIKAAKDIGLSESDKTRLQNHIGQRLQQLSSSQQDWPKLQKTLSTCHGLLGKVSAQDDDIAQSLSRVEKSLREHLQQDEQMHRELNQFITALQSSMKSVREVLSEVGEESPELKQVQDILEQELPRDASQAQVVLQQARQGLLQAGSKLSNASKSINHNMQTHLDQMSALSKRLEDAESAARNDPLTGLANRRKLAEFLSSLDKKLAVSFVMLDIDYFKKINDRYGHDAGDDILTALADVLISSTRSSDLVARLGGEEFCIVLPEAPLEPAKALAENLCQAVSLHCFGVEGHKINVTISLGVSQLKPNETHAACIKRADKALYQSKTNGRNCVTVVK